MSAQDWIAIIQAIGTAVTAALVVLIPLLIRELRSNTVATKQSAAAIQVSNAQAGAATQVPDPLAVLAAIGKLADSAAAPTPEA